MSAVATRERVQAFIEKQEGYFLIDVRDGDELEYGMLPTAKHISLGEVEDALRMTPDRFLKHYGFAQPKKDDVLIFYCRTGGRSARAANIALHCGFLNAKNYAGSVREWSQFDPNVKMYGP